MIEPPSQGSPLRKLTFWALVAVALFNAASAVGGGIAILATSGLGMPISMLTSSPFSSFTWPAVILIVVVGGTQLLAAALLLARRETALLWSAVAAMTILIWIFVETGMIGGNSWLQVLYFATGAAEFVLVLALLGVVAWLPRQPIRSTRARVRTR